MGEANRRKQLGLPPRERKTMSPEEKKMIITSAVRTSVNDVLAMWQKMNTPKK